MHRPGFRRKLTAALALALAAVVVAAALVYHTHTAHLASGTARGQITPPDTGTGCRTTDVGSGSVTDPARFGVDVPACAPQHYPTTLPGLRPATPLTPATLAKVDPKTLLWTMLTRSSTQKVTDLMTESFASPEDYTSHALSGLLTRVQLDYPARTFTAQSTNADLHTGTMQTDVFDRCVGHTQYTWSPQDPTWRPATSARVTEPCHRLQGDELADGDSNDSLIPGGLSDAQADRFLSYLDHIPGLITASTPQWVHGSDGTNYLQLDGQVVPQDPHNPHNTQHLDLGAAFLYAAFAQTGLDQQQWPYYTGVDTPQGLRFRYYLDPATLLPAYSVAMSTEPVLANGTPTGPIGNAYLVHEYSYPTALDPAAGRATGVPTLPLRAWPFPQATFPTGTNTPPNQTTTATRPSAPTDKPVPCDPQFPDIGDCFPPQVDPAAALATLTGWTCFHQGQDDGFGDTIRFPGDCDRRDVPGQPPGADQSIDYDTDSHQAAGRLNTIDIDVDFGAKTTSPVPGTTALFTLAATTPTTAEQAFWPHDPKARDDLQAAYQAAAPRCHTNSVTIRTSLGYHLDCEKPTTTSVAAPGVGDTVIAHTTEITITTQDE